MSGRAFSSKVHNASRGESFGWSLVDTRDACADAATKCNVALVQLAEGPRLLSNVVGLASEGEISDRMPVTAVFGREADMAVVRFAPRE